MASGATVRYCVSCGEPLIEGARFCGSCGHAADDPVAPGNESSTSPANAARGRSEPAPNRSRRRTTLVIALLLVVVAVGVLLWRSTPGDTNEKGFVMQSESMVPAIEVGDSVSFDVGAECCQRGDVVLFRSAPNERWRSAGVD